MKNNFLKLFMIALVSSVLFAHTVSAVVTNSVTTDPVATPEGEAVTLTAMQGADGTVDLDWNKYVGADFTGYKVVHSTTNPDLMYPADGYLSYITDSNSLSYVHSAPSAGLNYYRICTLVTSGVVCGNVVSIDSQFDLSTSEVTAVADPYSDDAAIQISLSANLNADGKVDLIWTKYSGGDLRWYKVMHSMDNPLPFYPVDEAVKAFSFAADTSYVHAPELGDNYYRVCVITIDDRRGCSNTQIVTAEVSGNMPIYSLFSDMNDHWARLYVNDLAADGVINGIDGKFAPDREVTRAEAIKMILYAFGDINGVCDATAFPDLKSSDWFCSVASLAKRKGYVTGDNGYLYPNRSLTRAEAVKIVIEVKGDIMAMVVLAPFSDVSKDAWYATYAAHAKKLGLVAGVDGKFLPTNNITRAELAKIISVAKKLYEESLLQ